MKAFQHIVIGVDSNQISAMNPNQLTAGLFGDGTESHRPSDVPMVGTADTIWDLLFPGFKPPPTIPAVDSTLGIRNDGGRTLPPELATFPESVAPKAVETESPMFRFDLASGSGSLSETTRVPSEYGTATSWALSDKSTLSPTSLSNSEMVVIKQEPMDEELSSSSTAKSSKKGARAPAKPRRSTRAKQAKPARSPTPSEDDSSHRKRQGGKGEELIAYRTMARISRQLFGVTPAALTPEQKQACIEKIFSKRERNSEAARRSREKARHHVEELELRVRELEDELEKEKAKRQELEAQLGL